MEFVVKNHPKTERFHGFAMQGALCVNWQKYVYQFHPMPPASDARPGIYIVNWKTWPLDGFVSI
jgi:hypothetical protein